jgi:hypothetical protein
MLLITGTFLLHNLLIGLRTRLLPSTQKLPEQTVQAIQSLDELASNAAALEAAARVYLQAENKEADPLEYPIWWHAPFYTGSGKQGA